MRALPIVFLTAFLAAACGSTAPALSPGGSEAQPRTAIASPATPASAGSPSPRATLAPRASLTTWTPALQVHADLPIGVLFANGSIWVTEHHSNKLLRIDPSSGRTEATISGVGAGAQQAFVAGGRIWVPSGNRLVAVDPKSNKVAATVSGSFSYVGAAAGGHAWIGDDHDGLLELDGVTGRTLATVPPPPAATQSEDCLNSVVGGSAGVWWSVNDAGLVERIDPTTAKVAGQADDVGHSTIALVGGVPWTDSNDGRVRKLDPVSASVTATVPLMDAASQNCAGPIAADGTALWIVGDGSFSDLYRIDTATGTVTAHIDPGDSDIQAIAVVDHSLWITFYDSGMVDRFDLPGS